MRALAFAIALALGPAGCVYGGGDVGSGIYGVATIGPTCPVEREPPEPACADRPFEGRLEVRRLDGGVVGVFSPDAQGRFNVSLQPGEYALRAAGDAHLPTCASAEPIRVLAGAWTRVVVACDSGIR